MQSVPSETRTSPAAAAANTATAASTESPATEITNSDTISTNETPATTSLTTLFLEPNVSVSQDRQITSTIIHMSDETTGESSTTEETNMQTTTNIETNIDVETSTIIQFVGQTTTSEQATPSAQTIPSGQTTFRGQTPPNGQTTPSGQTRTSGQTISAGQITNSESQNSTIFNISQTLPSITSQTKITTTFTPTSEENIFERPNNFSLFNFLFDSNLSESKGKTTEKEESTILSQDGGMDDDISQTTTFASQLETTGMTLNISGTTTAFSVTNISRTQTSTGTTSAASFRTSQSPISTLETQTTTAVRQETTSSTSNADSETTKTGLAAVAGETTTIIQTIEVERTTNVPGNSNVTIKDEVENSSSKIMNGSFDENFFETPNNFSLFSFLFDRPLSTETSNVFTTQGLLGTTAEVEEEETSPEFINTVNTIQAEDAGISSTPLPVFIESTEILTSVTSRVGMDTTSIPAAAVSTNIPVQTVEPGTTPTLLEQKIAGITEQEMTAIPAVDEGLFQPQNNFSLFNFLFSREAAGPTPAAVVAEEGRQSLDPRLAEGISFSDLLLANISNIKDIKTSPNGIHIERGIDLLEAFSQENITNSLNRTGKGFDTIKKEIEPEDFNKEYEMSTIKTLNDAQVLDQGTENILFTHYWSQNQNSEKPTEKANSSLFYLIISK